MVQEAFGELDALTAGLLPLLNQYRDGAIEWHRVQAYLGQFDALRADTIAAERVLGMASPMLTDIQDNPRAVELGILSLLGGFLDRGDKPRFPRVKAAVDWLLGRGVANEETLEKIPGDAKRLADEATSPFRGESIKREIEESLRLGEDRKTFQRRMRKNLNLRKGEEGTLIRTQAKRSYLQGQRATMMRPENRLRWPYVIAVSEDDNRTREHHRAIDFKYSRRAVQIGSPEHDQMTSIHGEWNCRCSQVPVSLKQAQKLGLETGEQ